MSTMEASGHLNCMVAVITDTHAGITRLTTGLISLQENVDTLYEYMTIFASHLVNPVIIPLDEL